MEEMEEPVKDKNVKNLKEKMYYPDKKASYFLDSKIDEIAFCGKNLDRILVLT